MSTAGAHMGVRAEQKAQTSSRLISAARTIFVERGYAQTSMDELCAAAGVTRGALYHNFGGKEGLFEAVARQIDEEITDRLLQGADGTPTLVDFIETCVAYLTMALEPEVQQIMFRDGPAVLGQRLREIDQGSSIELLRQTIAELQKSGVLLPTDATALGVLINGALVDAALWIASGDKDEARLDAAAHAVTSLIKGMVIEP